GSITVALGGGFEEDEGAFDAVPADVFFVNDFAARYFLAVRFALQERVAVCSAVNPSTLLLFARTLAERGEELARALDDGALGLDDASLASAGVDDARAGRLRARALKDPAAAARIRASATEHGAARMCDVLPALAGLVCWKGGSAPFYLDQLVHSYGPVPVLDYGYCASEGCFGAALSTDGAASVLLPHGHVIELIAEDDVDEVRAGKKPTVLLHEAQVGARYFVVVTTGAGLYRYEMNDLIEIVGKRDQAPLAIFRHKGGAMSSITGEKIGESHVVSAMASAAKTTGARVAGFAVAPLLPLPSSSSSSSAAAAVLAAAEPRYVLAIDAPALADAALAALARAFDEALAIENEEYDAKRKSLRLDAVIAARLPADSIATHRKKRVDGGAPDAHVKIPHVSPDGALLIELGFALSAPDLAAQLPCARAPPPKSA
ncbi:MAG TPA: GH3 auxin-responsive promoter family protein, partial [Myxococcota bacterium]